MRQKYDDLPCSAVRLRGDAVCGTLDYDRQMIGIGGASPAPIPGRVRPAMRVLGKRLIRVFLQEYFFVYPDHGVFDWSRLDAFMDSLEETGCQVMASICLKPKVLYPRVDPKIFMPNDPAEWQALVRALVRRYSVERPLVTYWGVLNEINIGEDGGCPHEIKNPDDYFAYYQMTVSAIREACPGIKVGGPSLAGYDAPYMERFAALCREHHVPVDFLSYNIYSGSPAVHTDAARKACALAAALDGQVEVYQTELNNWFPDHYVQEVCYSGRYSASLAAILMDLNDTPLSGSFQFDMYDALVNPDDFEQFYSRVPFMLHHWNEVPHRFGLFDQEGRVRPQYFVYRLLDKMKGERLSTVSETPDIRAAACRVQGGYRLLMTNYNEEASTDRVAEVCLSGIRRGAYRLRVYRIDDERHWEDASLSLLPTEDRPTYALENFSCHVLLPADSVALFCLEPEA